MGQATTPSTLRRTTNALELVGIGPERDQFLENLSLLVGSGTGVLVALDSLQADARSHAMRRIIGRVRADVDAGQPLSKALAATGLLSPQVISLLAIGESSGRLPENLKVVAVQQQKERLFQSKLVSAMIYPALVFGITILVGLIIAWFILPKLALVFGQLQLDLPVMTKILIAVGAFLNRYGIVAVPALIAAGVVATYLCFFAAPTRWIGERFILAIPGLRRVVVEVELARFSYVMGTLLEAGLPVLDTLGAIESATPFTTYRRLYGHLRRQLADGHSFRSALESYPNVRLLVPIPIQQLINASEQSGSLAGSFLRISALYEEKTDITTKNLVVVIEPVLLVLVWLGVMFVAVAVILPIYRLVGEFNTTALEPATSTEPTVTEAETPVSVPVVAKAVPEAPADGLPLPGTVLGARDPAATAAASQPTVLVADGVSYVNVRDRPSEHGALVGRAEPGTDYPVLAADSGWYQITLPAGGVGWVSGQFVTTVQQ